MSRGWYFSYVLRDAQVELVYLRNVLRQGPIPRLAVIPSHRYLRYPSHYWAVSELPSECHYQSVDERVSQNMDEYVL